MMFFGLVVHLIVIYGATNKPFSHVSAGKTIIYYFHCVTFEFSCNCQLAC